MSFSIRRAVEFLQDEVADQWTPEPLTVGQYEGMVLYGIKRLYTDTGRALAYDTSNYTIDEEEGLLFNEDLPIDEQEYVMLCAKINFFKRVQTEANNAVDYSTNAIKVSGVGKRMDAIKGTLDDLEARRRELFYHMPRYTLDYAITD